MHRTSTYINQEYRKDYPQSSKQCFIAHQMENKTFEESKRTYLQEITLDAPQLTTVSQTPGPSLEVPALGEWLQRPAPGCHPAPSDATDPIAMPCYPSTPPFLGACQIQQPSPPQVRGNGDESLFLLSRKAVVHVGHPSDQIQVHPRGSCFQTA